MFFLIPFFSFLFCIPNLFSQVELNAFLDAALKKSSSGEMTVLVRFRPTGKMRVSGKESRSDLQKMKMREALESQSGFFSMLQTRKKTAGELKQAESLWVNNSVILTASKGFISNLLNRDDILRILPDREMHLQEPIRPSGKPSRATVDYTYGLLKIRAPEVWDSLGIDGEGVTVGLLDTGWADHPELRGRVLLSKDFVSDYHFNQPNDGHGHGSHCLGTIGGGSLGGKSIGVAPKVKFIVGKIFSDSGSTTLTKIMRAMQWIADPDENPDTADQPRVISNSWGGGAGSMESEQEMWDIVTTWRELGIVPVFAAGNSGPSEETVGTPGGYPHSFAVGATDDEDDIAYFSSKGPIAWGGQQYIKPDVSAPGVDIFSLNKANGYTLMSGTSMATPHVAGVVALMLQANPELSVADIEMILKNTSVDQGDAGMDNTYGQGRVDAFAAVSTALNGGTLEMQVSADNYEALISIQPGGYGYLTQGGVLKTALPQGSYSIEVSAFGHLTQIFGVEIKKKQTSHLEASLEKSARFKVGFDIRTTEGLSLGGKISFPDSPMRGDFSDSGLVQLEMPAGDYQVLATKIGYRPKSFEISVNADRVIQAEMQKLPQVLLVDDDMARDFEQYYTSALSDNDIDFALVEHGTDDVMGYETVIWFTGNDHAANSIKEPEQVMLSAYLESGGRLIISGQDLGYGMNSKDFFTSVLGAHWVKDVSDSKTILGQGLSFQLDGEDSAKNQKWPDVIDVPQGSETASAFLNYDGGAVAGLLNHYGNGKVIYLGFGFEGVSGRENRKLLMRAMIDVLKMSTSDRLNRISWAYQNHPALYPILTDQFKVNSENLEQVQTFMRNVRLKSPYRSVLNSLKDL